MKCPGCKKELEDVTYGVVFEKCYKGDVGVDEDGIVDGEPVPEYDLAQTAKRFYCTYCSTPLEDIVDDYGFLDFD